MVGIIYTVLCIVSLIIGIVIGYKLKPSKVEEPLKKVEVKKMTPIQKIKKNREDRELEEAVRKETQRYQDILDNINNYDGTGNNQKEIK